MRLFLLSVEANTQNFFSIFIQILSLRVVTEKFFEQEKNLANLLGHVNCIIYVQQSMNLKPMGENFLKMHSHKLFSCRI